MGVAFLIISLSFFILTIKLSPALNGNKLSFMKAVYRSTYQLQTFISTLHNTPILRRSRYIVNFIFYYIEISIMTNSILSQKEIEYLKSQRLARIATAAFPTHEERSVQPDVVPVGFDFEWGE
jgi:hypothetical protein